MSKFLCGNCGAENDADAKFCKNCGTKIEVAKTECEGLEGQGNEEVKEIVDTERNELIEAQSTTELEAQTTVESQEESVFTNHAKPKKKLKKRVIIPLVLVGLILIFLFIPIKPKVTGLEVQYSGDREEGIVLDENNEGLNVIGITEDGSKVELTGWTIEQPVTLVSDETAIVKISYKDLSYSLGVECSTSKVVSIAADYSGSTEAGVMIDNSSNISVVQTHLNGEVTETTNWKILNPTKLAADETATIKITSEGLETELQIDCSTVTVVEIKASYDGDTSENTVLDSKNAGIHVEATYKNGKKEKVKGFIIDKPATLEAGKTATVKIAYEGLECELRVECTSMTPSQYKESCKKIAYEDLARNPDKYAYENVKFTGKVVQTMEDGGVGALRVNVTKGSYGHYSDTVYVMYVIDKSNRILEDDIVTFYGMSMGLMSYETVMGATVTIPEVYAEYVDLN